MQSVKKGNPPKLLQDWLRMNTSSANQGYESMPADVKSDLRIALELEQRNICLYTGLTITSTNSHIEHLIPQATSKAKRNVAETTDYRNLMVAYTDTNFGAVFKADWPGIGQEQDFLKPTDQSCSGRFKYIKDGSVETGANDRVATETLKRLNLNHKYLVEGRRDAWSNLFTGLTPAQITKTYLRNRLNELQNPKAAYAEAFYFVKQQYLERVLEQKK